MFRLHYIPLLKLLYFTCKNMRNNSKTDRIKSAQYKVESWHYKMAFAYKQKIFKKILQISQIHTFISPVIGPKCQVNWTRWVEMRTKFLRGSGEGMKPQSLSKSCYQKQSLCTWKAHCFNFFCPPLSEINFSWAIKWNFPWLLQQRAWTTFTLHINVNV